MKKLIFSVIVTMMFSLGSWAQQFITTSMDMPEKPMATLAINSAQNTILSEGAKVSMHWQCFDQGQRTAIIHIEWPEFLKQYQQGRPNTKVLDFSYSGKKLYLVKGSQGNASYYMITRDKTMLAMIVTQSNNGKMITSVQINNTDNCHLIDDVYLGMNIDELKDLTSRTLKNSKVKFVGNSGVNKVYELTWLGERDKYVDLSGTTHSTLSFDEPNGRFWFDAKGKLVKWYSWRAGSNM